MKKFLNLILTILNINNINFDPIQQVLIEVNPFLLGIPKGREMDISIDDSGGFVSEIIIFLEGIGDKFIMLITI